MAYLDRPDAIGHGPAARQPIPSQYAPPRHSIDGGEPFVWPLLADDFFRLAHDDTTGRPRLNARDGGVGLAAALLGELTVARKVEPHSGLLFVHPGAGQPPTDALAHAVLDQIVMDPQQHDLRAWLVALGLGAYERVANRLLRAGHVQRVAVRRPLRATEVRYLPVDANTAVMPWARLSIRLANLQTLHTLDAFLAGLVAATGLAGHVLAGAPRDALAYMAHLVAQLPPPLRELVAHTEVVVGEAVLGNRR